MPRKDPVSHLARFESPPVRLLDEIRALGPAAAPALRALLDAPGALLPDTPARHAAAAAAPLYGELAGVEAIPRLVEVALHAPPRSDLQTGAVLGLHAVTPGAAVVDAIFALPDPPADREATLLWALVGAGVPDARIGARLRALLARDPAAAAPIAAASGDRSLADDLRRAFDALPAHTADDLDAMRLAESLLAAASRLAPDTDDPARWARLRDRVAVARATLRRELEDLAG